MEFHAVSLNFVIFLVSWCFIQGFVSVESVVLLSSFGCYQLIQMKPHLNPCHTTYTIRNKHEKSKGEGDFLPGNWDYLLLHSGIYANLEL